VPLLNEEHQRWLEISIHIHPVAHEALSAFLFDLGCKGLVYEDFLEHFLKAYFPFQENFEDLQGRINVFLQKLKEIFPEVQSPKLTFTKIEDQDWSRNWQHFFRPQRITRRLMVLPAWEPVPLDLEDQVIRIDPGPAFGTGQHPTTRMCLEAMEKVILAESWTMLDVGTGSGILAIYAAKLGASRVVALDLDPEAIRWAERNIHLNNLSGAIELSSMPLETWRDPFSLLTANLTLGVILELFSNFNYVLHPGGCLILSGILRDQVKDLQDCFAEYGFSEEQVLYQAEWACVLARKVGED
jgi:ribosomal protein L11 methyltransferase